MKYSHRNLSARGLKKLLGGELVKTINRVITKRRPREGENKKHERRKALWGVCHITSPSCGIPELGYASDHILIGEGFGP